MASRVAASIPARSYEDAEPCIRSRRCLATHCLGRWRGSLVFVFRVTPRQAETTLHTAARRSIASPLHTLHGCHGRQPMRTTSYALTVSRCLISPAASVPEARSGRLRRLHPHSRLASAWLPLVEQPSAFFGSSNSLHSWPLRLGLSCCNLYRCSGSLLLHLSPSPGRPCGGASHCA